MYVCMLAGGSISRLVVSLLSAGCRTSTCSSLISRQRAASLLGDCHLANCTNDHHTTPVSNDNHYPRRSSAARFANYLNDNDNERDFIQRVVINKSRTR